VHYYTRPALSSCSSPGLIACMIENITDGVRRQLCSVTLLHCCKQRKDFQPQREQHLSTSSVLQAFCYQEIEWHCNVPGATLSSIVMLSSRSSPRATSFSSRSACSCNCRYWYKTIDIRRLIHTQQHCLFESLLRSNAAGAK
jgi:hypothetical protein